MSESPDYGFIGGSASDDSAKAGEHLKGITLHVESAWCFKCKGEDGDHTPTCPAQN